MKAIENLNKERDLNWKRDSYLSKINDKTETFVRIHKTRLKDGGSTMKKKSQVNGEVIGNNNNNVGDKKKGTGEVVGKNVDGKFWKGHLNSLLELTAQALLERDGLADEKNRALRILDLPGTFLRQFHVTTDYSYFCVI